jgi:UDP-glucose 4-epimerase
MQVVVTGGAGFIGSNLCRHLLASGYDDVTVIDDLSTGDVANLDGLDVRLCEASILDEDQLDRVVKAADVVVHLAARPSVQRSVDDPVATNRVNVNGTLNVLEAARRHGGRYVIVASSSSVYGANAALPKDEDLRCEPVSPYAVSKLAAESYATAFQRTYGLPTLCVRLFNVFGPRQSVGHAYAAVVPSFVAAALAGDPVTIYGTGEQSRDFTYVRTICRLLTDAVKRRVTSARPVNLGFGNRLSLVQLLDEIEGILGRPIERRHVSSRIGDVPHSQAAGARMRGLFPEVAQVPLPVGIRETVEWFRVRHGLPVAAG